MKNQSLKAELILSILVAILAAISSAAGIFTGLYRDNALVTAAFRGNDAVTLFVTVPMMVIAMLLVRRGSLRGRVVWLGTLSYMIYNYVFYLYGAAYNRVFLFYVALVALSIYTMVSLLVKLNIQEITARLSPKLPRWWIAGFMWFVVLTFGVMIELTTAVSSIFTGQIPQTVIASGHPTSVVFAADLSLFMPAMALGGVWLAQRKAWGYVLAAIMWVKGATYTLALLFMSLFAYLSTGAGDAYTLLYAVYFIGGSLCFWALIASLKNQPTNPAE